MNVQKITAILVLLAFLLSGCNSAMPLVSLYERLEDVNKNADLASFEEPVILAKSDNFSLQFDPVSFDINLLSNETGKVEWSTGVDEKYYGVEIKNNLIRKGLHQLISVNYTNFANISETKNNLDSTCKTSTKAINDGIRFEFEFSKAKIKLALEITLADDQLKARIPIASVEERGDYGLTSVSILPMLGATRSDAQGYFLYPDGCGALYQFGTRMETGKTVSMAVYDEMLLDLDRKEENIKAGMQTVMMPVFGINRGTSGLFANIVKGAEDCSINLETDGSGYAINRLYAILCLRKPYTINTSDGDKVYTYQKKITCSDVEIIYTPIQGDDCGYSAMANIYRQYLSDNKLLNKHSKNAPPLALDFMMSVGKKSMLGDKKVILTTFKQVEDILNELKDMGITDIQSFLYGWRNEGYGVYPTVGGVSGQAGGKKGLKELASKHDVYLIENYIDADAGGRGYSKQSDVIYSINGFPLTNRQKDTYLLNPLTQISRLIVDISLHRSLDANIAFEKFGSMLYEDFNNNNRLSRYGFTQASTLLIKRAKDAGLKVAIDGFAPYLSNYADTLFNLPLQNSNLLAWAKTVPFLQMVLHGSISYSAVLPGNLSADFTNTKLNWVEYGYMPTFLLTYNDADELIGSNYGLLFSSKYNHWKDCVVNTALEFSSRLSGVYDKYMVFHSKTDGVATVVYEDGTTVYINYNTDTAVCNDIEVPPLDYVVVN